MREELRRRVEPLIGGIQIQNRKRKGIGTLACIVYDINTGTPCGLSNKHIIRKRIGFSVVQPATRRRTNEFIIGNVLRKSRIFDSAIFSIDVSKRSIDLENSIYGLQGRISNTIEPVVGMKVQKVGQFTGHTFGIVDKVYESGVVKIIPNSDKPSPEISEGGDSGSLWVTDDETDFKAVCLHTGGEGDLPKDEAWGIKISLIMKDLEIRF